MLKTEKIFIPSSQGKLSAVVHHPGRPTDKLAVLCPGKLDSKDYTHLVALADALAGRGYTAVRFDPTGTWDSEGAINDYTTTQYLDDLKNVLAFFKKTSDIKSILLAGHSFGGMIIMLHAAEDTSISTVVGIMPSHAIVQDKLTEWEKSGFRSSKRDIPGKKGTREFKLPYSYVQDRLKYNALDTIGRFQGLFIAIAGEMDDIVSPEEVKMVYDHAKKPKHYILMEGIGHNYRLSAEEVFSVNERILGLIP